MLMLQQTPSLNSASVRVEKATSEFLINPDWTMNINICDAINSNHWLAKDVVKALRRRFLHKNPNVHILTLTLLGTMVKNCGDHVHSLIVERHILQDLVKIVKKNANMRVREKILILLDSWQEAFGGARGKHPQYYRAYDELKRFGVEFAPRTSDSALMFTPPVVTNTRPSVGHARASNSSTWLDQALASETETLSLSNIKSKHEVLDLLSSMLQATSPNDCMSVKDEVMVDLVNRCRSNHKKLIQMLTTTGDEELLRKGLALNDSIQNELARHDAIAAGSSLPTQSRNFKPQTTVVPSSSFRPDDISSHSSSPSSVPSASLNEETRNLAEDEEEEEEDDDDFVQQVRRHSKSQSPKSQETLVGTSETTPAQSNALALPDAPEPAVKVAKDQDMIDLLSLTLSTTGPLCDTQQFSTENAHQAPVSSVPQGHSYASHTYPGNHEHAAFNSYVAPWAQPQSQYQPQPQPLHQAESQLQPQAHVQPSSQKQTQYVPTGHFQHPNLQLQAHNPEMVSSGYPPPPWAATPGYYSHQNALSTSTYLTSQATNALTPYAPLKGGRPLHQVNSISAEGSNGVAQMSLWPSGNAPAAGHKAFVPSYRLFEDLNVLGNGDGRFRTNNNTSPRLSGTSPTQSMVAGRK